MTAAVTEFTARCLSSSAGAHARDELSGITNDARLRRREDAFRVLRGHERAEVNSLDDVGTEPKPWLVLRAHAARWHADPFAPVVDPDDVEAWK
jgi:hypothetical protein